jgi:hypothetical protein
LSSIEIQGAKTDKQEKNKPPEPTGGENLEGAQILGNTKLVIKPSFATESLQ